MLVRPEVIQDPYSDSGPLHAKLQSNFGAPAFPHLDRTHYCDTFKLLLCLYNLAVEGRYSPSSESSTWGRNIV